MHHNQAAGRRSIIVGVVLTIGLAACGTSTGALPAADTSVASPSSEHLPRDPTGDPSLPTTVIDQTGAEVTVSSIERIIPDVLLVPDAGLASVGGIDGLLEIGGLSRTPAGQARRVLSYDDQLLLGNGPRVGDLRAELSPPNRP